MSAEKYKNLKVKELQDLLQKNGLPHSGKKEELIERLVKHDEQNQEFASLEEEFSDLEEFDASKVNLDDLTDKPIEDLSALDENLEPTKSNAAEELSKKAKEPTQQTEETPTAATPPATAGTKPNSNFKFTPITFDKKPTEEDKSVTTTTTAPVTTPNKPKSLNDAERALERAKRFGIQVNESAKKDIRAQRFGIANKASPSKGRGVDSEVLKKRAERFGITPAQATVASAKGKVPVKLDAAEEEKKRKRAERFNTDNKKQKSE